MLSLQKHRPPGGKETVISKVIEIAMLFLPAAPTAALGLKPRTLSTASGLHAGLRPPCLSAECGGNWSAGSSFHGPPACRLAFRTRGIPQEPYERAPGSSGEEQGLRGGLGSSEATVHTCHHLYSVSVLRKFKPIYCKSSRCFNNPGPMALSCLKKKKKSVLKTLKLKQFFFFLQETFTGVDWLASESKPSCREGEGASWKRGSRTGPARGGAGWTVRLGVDGAARSASRGCPQGQEKSPAVLVSRKPRGCHASLCTVPHSLLRLAQSARARHSGSS